jgi:hypothetical protein
MTRSNVGARGGQAGEDPPFVAVMLPANAIEGNNAIGNGNQGQGDEEGG